MQWPTASMLSRTATLERTQPCMPSPMHRALVEMLPFFFVYAYADDQLLVARGRSGGLACWGRMSAEDAAANGTLQVVRGSRRGVLGPEGCWGRRQVLTGGLLAGVLDCLPASSHWPSVGPSALRCCENTAQAAACSGS
jgi:hypothetical protein